MADGINPKSSSPTRVFTIVGFSLILIFWAALAFGFFESVVEKGPLSLWLTSIVLILIVLGLAGHEIDQRSLGVLIDGRNKISLSRLQITLWTVMVMSAYLSIAIPRIASMVGAKPVLTSQNVLDISFPEELIVAMGISAASFTGSNLIKSSKKSKNIKMSPGNTPDAAAARRDQAKSDLDLAQNNLADLVKKESDAQDAVKDAKSRLTSPAAGMQHSTQEEVDAKQMLLDAISKSKKEAIADRDRSKETLDKSEKEVAAINEAQGLLHKNNSPSDASWSDLFRGDEIANYQLVDMSKVQMLFFTVVVIVAYGAAIASMLRDLSALKTASNMSFPEFSQSLNALLGISHATYLSVQSVDR